MLMLISVIIPVYNVEKYIGNCISSILNQNVNDFLEIILIDDGSSDDSLSVIKEFERNYKNIKVIAQSNKGVSAARNVGMKNAEGKYVYFVDSDDFLEPHSLVKVVELLNKNPIDVLLFKYSKVNESYEAEHFKDYYIYDNSSHKMSKFLKNNTIVAQVWMFIYNLEALRVNNISFIEGVYHEDEDFVSKSLAVCENIYLMDHKVYNYVKRPNSIITTTDPKKNKKKLKDISTVILSLKEFEKSIFDKGKKVGINRKLEQLTMSLVLKLMKLEDEMFNRDILVKLKDYNLIPLKYSNSSFKIKLMSFYLNNFYLRKIRK